MDSLHDDSTSSDNNDAKQVKEYSLWPLAAWFAWFTGLTVAGCVLTDLQSWSAYSALGVLLIVGGWMGGLVTALRFFGRIHTVPTALAVTILAVIGNCYHFAGGLGTGSLGFNTVKVAWCISLAVLLLAMLSEFFQVLIKKRRANVQDMLWYVAGIMLTAMLVYLRIQR